MKNTIKFMYFHNFLHFIFIFKEYQVKTLRERYFTLMQYEQIKFH